MRLCAICQRPFKPTQRFETLFKQERICSVCIIKLESPLNIAVLPLEGSEAYVHSFDERAHPAHFTLILHHMLATQKTMLVWEKAVLNDDVLSLIKGLCQPLYLYSPQHLTLDELERLIA